MRWPLAQQGLSPQTCPSTFTREHLSTALNISFEVPQVWEIFLYDYKTLFMRPCNLCKYQVVGFQGLSVQRDKVDTVSFSTETIYYKHKVLTATVQRFFFFSSVVIYLVYYLFSQGKYRGMEKRISFPFKITLPGKIDPEFDCDHN